MIPAESERPSVVEKRELFREEVCAVDPAHLLFLDESGSNIAMTRDYARARRCDRVYGIVPRNRGKVLTMIGTMGLDGLRALSTVEGGTDKAVFLDYLRTDLAPKLQRGDVLVLDNLGAHHATGVREIVEAAGARIIYMPPYSPDLNPIELCWSKLKAALKRIGARTITTLRAAVAAAAKLVVPSDAAGWFDHCGLDVSTRPV